jgi:acetyl esterase/lipase
MSTSDQVENLDPILITLPLLNSIPDSLVGRFDPVYVEWYDKYSAGRLATHQVPIEAYRAHPEKYTIAYGRDRVSEKGLRIVDRKCPVKGGEITIRIFQRDASSTTAKPVYVNFHGGGWVFGGLPTDFDFCKRIVQHLDCVAFDVDYRLAPEHPYPIPVEDCVAAMSWASI